MVNLNECKFGDKLKMRNGKMPPRLPSFAWYSGHSAVFLQSPV